MGDLAVRYLVMWDIDRTLVETRGLGTELFRLAFQAATGLTADRSPTVIGRTELAIFTGHSLAHGIEPSAEMVERYTAALTGQYEANADLLRVRGTRLPGAAEALATLAGDSCFVQTLLTGNLRAVSLVKLRAFGLADFVDFDVGAYGDDDQDRSNLVVLARRRASTQYGVEFGRSNTVLIGDTVEDVEAAQLGGATVIGVASGRDSLTALTEARADVVLPDLTNVVAAIHDVLNPTGLGPVAAPRM